MGRVGYGYGCGMQILMNPEMIGSTAPAGVFGWDGAAGSCIQMDTASKMSFVYIMHVRNCGMAYGIIHPTLRDMVFTK
jgi:CubicO group peptidase (beta-lactamase class C family)